jgi:hypothetical protein
MPRHVRRRSRSSGNLDNLDRRKSDDRNPFAVGNSVEREATEGEADDVSTSLHESLFFCYSSFSSLDTVKISLSPRPQRLTMMMRSAAMIDAIFMTSAIA